MEIGLCIQEKDYDEFLASLKKIYDITSISTLEEYSKSQNEYSDEYDYENQYVLELQKKKVGRKQKFTDKEIEAILEMRNAGASLREIAKRTNSCKQTIASYLLQNKNNK